MSISYESYLRSISKTMKRERLPGKYKMKLMRIKSMIRDTIIESTAVCDEISEVEELTLIRMEERKFLLRKLCQFDPQTEAEVQKAISAKFPQPTAIPSDKKGKKKNSEPGTTERKPKSRRSSKTNKKLVQPLPLDPAGRPIFPIVLGNLTVHSLGDVIHDRPEFHCEDSIFPVGYVSTRTYAGIRDPTASCLYTCKISDINGMPRFEIVPENDQTCSVVGGSPDMCHSILLQQINDSLSLNVVSTKPRGNEFFGLTHPSVMNLIQSCPGAKKCAAYKWTKFEVSKGEEQCVDETHACLSFDALQRSISVCKFKMAPNMTAACADSYLETLSSFGEHFMS